MQIPKPVIALAVLALLGGGAWYATRPAAQAQWLGYVEAETMYVAAPVSGRLAERKVERGATVEAGAMLFSLDPESTDADTARLEAQLSAAPQPSQLKLISAPVLIAATLSCGT